MKPFPNVRMRHAAFTADSLSTTRVGRVLPPAVLVAFAAAKWHWRGWQTGPGEVRAAARLANLSTCLRQLHVKPRWYGMYDISIHRSFVALSTATL